MSKQISITIPDDIYKVLEGASEESLRPIATEAVYRIKMGLKLKSFKEVYNSDVVGYANNVPTRTKQELQSVEIKPIEKEWVGPQFKDKVKKGSTVKSLEKSGMLKRASELKGKRGRKELPSQTVDNFTSYLKK